MAGLNKDYNDRDLNNNDLLNGGTLAGKVGAVYVFEDTAERDAFFVSYPNLLVTDMLIVIKDGTAIAHQRYSGVVWVTTSTAHTGEVTGATALTLDKTAISNQADVPILGTDILLIGDTSDSGNLKKGAVQDIVDLVPATDPAGADGDLQINDSGVFGTLAGLNLDKTGNARGTNALDMQGNRSAVTQVASGENSVAFGSSNTASAYNGSAIGVGNEAKGNYDSFASGSFNSASGGYGSTASGYHNTSSASYASAIGSSNTASGTYSSAIGNNNTASALKSTVLGVQSTASGYYSTAVGSLCNSTGFFGTTLGFYNTASGYYSTASGYNNTASGSRSISIGTQNVAGGDTSTAIGHNLAVNEDNTIFGNSSKYANLNTVGLSIDNKNALENMHCSGDLLVTDKTSLGSELVTNGSFSGSATGWTLGSFTYWGSRIIKSADGTSPLTQTLSITAGKYYYITFDYFITNITTNLNVSLGGSSVEPIKTGAENYKAIIKTTTTGDLTFTTNNTGRVGKIDNVSVKEITGGDIKVPIGKVLIGNDGGEDMEVSYGGTVGLIDTGKVNPSDLDIDCGTEKTLELIEPVWNDYTSPIISTKPGATAPTFTTFLGNLKQYTFGVNDEVHGTMEILHGYKEGTDFDMHIHWATNGTDGTDRKVKWELEYTIQNSEDGVDGVFPTPTVVSGETTIDANTASKSNVYTDIATIDGTDIKMGAILCFRLRRISSTGTEPTSDPFGLQLGMHYQINTMGSRQELVK